MSLEIKISNIQPIRHTYAHIAKRFGDKPATRYQEATYDIEAAENFHYRPLWNPDKTLNDKTYTKVVMADWYALKDPRQFYYGAYVQNRAKMQEASEASYAFFDKRDLQANLSEDVKQKIEMMLLPLRYIDQTANLNYMYAAAYSYGAAVNQACIFASMDRLGMAQYISRIGLLISNNENTSLKQAESYWMQALAWQPLRALCENLLVQKDWFELFVAQALVLDTFVNIVHYQVFDNWLVNNEGRDIAMLTDFMKDCFKDLANWSDSLIKTAVAESDANRELIQQWRDIWTDKVHAAYQPLLQLIFDEQQLAIINDTINDELTKRIKKVGLI